MRRVEISPGSAPAYEHVSPILPARMNGVPTGYACGMTAVLTHPVRPEFITGGKDMAIAQTERKCPRRTFTMGD